ncbi:MAG: hypothetical protein AAGD33_00550 [Actinomycetota bacterium]
MATSSLPPVEAATRSSVADVDLVAEFEESQPEDRDLFWQYSATFWVVALDDVRVELGEPGSESVVRGVVSDVVARSAYNDQYADTAEVAGAFDPRPGDAVVIADRNGIGFDPRAARSTDTVIGLQPGADAYVLAFVAVEEAGRWTFTGPIGEVFTNQARRLEEHLGGVDSQAGLRAVHEAVLESNATGGRGELAGELATAMHVPGVDGVPWSLSDPLGSDWNPDLIPDEQREAILVIGVEFVLGDGLGELGPDGPIGLQVVGDLGVSHEFEWAAGDHFALGVVGVPGGLEVLGEYENGSGPALLRLTEPRAGQVAVVSVSAIDGALAVKLEEWRPPADDEIEVLADAGFGADGRLDDG